MGIIFKLFGGAFVLFATFFVTFFILEMAQVPGVPNVIISTIFGLYGAGKVFS